MTRARPPPINTRTTRGLAIEMHLTVVAITIEPIPASPNPRPAKARPGSTSQSAADEADRALGNPVINLRATGRVSRSW